MTSLEKFKLSTVSWDSDKEPKQFYVWLENFGSLVRATEHGSWLEDMLDSKLGRRKVSSQSVPSFLLNDPDFAIESTGESPGETGDGETGDSQSTATTTSGHFSLGTHSVTYAELPQEAKSLDGLLYNVIRMNIRGTKQQLLSCVTFPSYVQAVCILSKHMGISRMERIMSAFSEFDRLTYTGNVMLFQTQSMSLKRELDNCGATIVHFTIAKLMQAFAGKSKTVQFKIAEDFNKMDLDNPDINLYDMVQRYCSELAAVEGHSSSGHQVNHVGQIHLCTNCSGKKHNLSECPKLSKAVRKQIKALQAKGEKVIVCYECGETGHFRSDCPLLQEAREYEHKADESSVPTQSAPPVGSPGTADTSTHPVNTARLTKEELHKLVSKLRGDGKIALVTAEKQKKLTGSI